MAAPFQIIPATLDHTAEILALEQLCYPAPWEERLVRPFLVAAGLPDKGFIARVMKAGDTAVAYAFASRQEGQLLVERLGVRPEYRQKGIGSGLMVLMIYAARDWEVTCHYLFVRRGQPGRAALSQAWQLQCTSANRRGTEREVDSVCEGSERVMSSRRVSGAAACSFAS